MNKIKYQQLLKMSQNIQNTYYKKQYIRGLKLCMKVNEQKYTAKMRTREQIIRQKKQKMYDLKGFLDGVAGRLPVVRLNALLKNFLQEDDADL